MARYDDFHGPNDRRKIRERASQAAEDIADAGDRVATTSILPWHRAATSARSKYVAHSDQWVDWMTAIERDETAFDQERSQIDSTFRIAHRRFKRAAQWVLLYDVKSRVGDVFDPALIDPDLLPG